MVEVLVLLYLIIGIVVALGIYMKSPSGWQSLVLSIVVGLIWPFFLLVILTSGDRDI